MISKHFSRSEVECRCQKCGGAPDDKILAIADALREEWGGPIGCSSGFRCEGYALYLRMHGIPAAVKSAHNEGRAMDLTVEIGRMKEFHQFIQARLEKYDIWMEHPASTKSWAHIQTRPVRGSEKSRVFRP